MTITFLKRKSIINKLKIETIYYFWPMPDAKHSLAIERSHTVIIQ